MTQPPRRSGRVDQRPHPEPAVLADGSLEAAALAGDHDALRRVWEMNRRWVAAVLLAHKPRLDELDDLLQEVAMILVSRIHTVREPAHLRAWLRTVAINAARASARTQRSRPMRNASDLHIRDSEVPFASMAASAPEHREVDEEQQRVLALLREMPEMYREPLMMRAMKGMSSREIAVVLEISEQAVDTRVARARQMLRDAATKPADDSRERTGNEQGSRTCTQRAVEARS